ncbi:IclR family transcriptional regulator [Azorhizobium oxalatiphilum]|nr:IclR family transcriptional regulator [Azorhizobium oxalatiphilum]
MTTAPHIPPEPQSESVPALRRAVRVLDFVGAAPHPPHAADIARALGLPKSTAHGLIACMVELELLTRGADGTLRLGSHLMRWAGGFLGQTDMVSAFRDVLAESPALGDHTVTLSLLDGTDVVYLACRNSPAPLGITFRIGMRLPAQFTATGKAVLATLPPARVAALLQGPWPAGLTPHSVAGLPDLTRELEETRARGFSIDDGQVREGMVCLGAAVRDHSTLEDGPATAGIAISLLAHEASETRRAELAGHLTRIAAALSSRLGAG